jgi:hypothetical protein
MNLTSDLSEQLKPDKYYMNGNQDDGYLTNLHIKHDSFTFGDVDSAFEELKHLRQVFKIICKDNLAPIKGPLMYVAGNVTVTISKSDGTYLFQPFLNSG